VPEQEVEPDILGVLDHEDKKQPESGGRDDRSTTELPPLAFRGTACAATTILLNNESSSSQTETVRPEPAGAGDEHLGAEALADAAPGRAKMEE
jgi:hypothetical protein